MLTRVVVWSVFVLAVAVFCLLRPQAARLFVGGFFGVMGLVVQWTLGDHKSGGVRQIR
jgi:hypothetical protein